MIKYIWTWLIPDWTGLIIGRSFYMWKSFRLRLNFRANEIRTCLIENRPSRRMINFQIYLPRKQNIPWKKRYSTLSNYFHTQNDLIVHCLVLSSPELAIFKYTRQIYLTEKNIFYILFLFLLQAITSCPLSRLIRWDLVFEARNHAYC